MTRIAHVTSVHPRHDIRIFAKECMTLAAKGFGPVTLFVADGKGDESAGMVSIRDVGLSGAGRIGRAALGNWRLFRAVRSARAELVHFHDPELLPTGIVLALMGRKVIYDIHEDVPRQIMSKYWIPKVLRTPTAALVRFGEWIGTRLFVAVVAATPSIAKRFSEHRAQSVTVQNFPIRDELIAPATTEYASRLPAFAYVGALSGIRCARQIVEAIDHLNEQGEGMLELGGFFSHAAMEYELRAMPGWRYTRFHGWLSRTQVADLFGRVRAGLVLFQPMPNHVDAQPNKMFEYMAAGLPVIASDFPLWRDIIGGADCGVLVDPMDTKAIAGAMRWVLEHSVEAEEMGRRGRAAVANRYNWENESQALVKLYVKVLGGKTEGSEQV